jgi:paxillin
MLNKTGIIRDHAERTESPLPHRSLDPNSRLPQPTKPPIRSSPLKFFASSTAPKPDVSLRTQKIWQANFLNDLRSNRPARPSGSRPLPDRAGPRGLPPAQDLPLRTSSAMSRPIRESEGLGSCMPDRCSSAMSHRRVQSKIPDTISMDEGGPVVEQSRPVVGSRDISMAQGNMVAPSATYRESGQRWMEKQEARSLREALEDMDLRDEGRLHEAAQDEASELVRKHMNPHALFKNPDARYDYKLHLRKGSHARSQSSGRYGVGSQYEPRLPTTIPLSDKPMPAESENADSSCKNPTEQANVASVDPAGGKNGHALWDSSQKRAYMNMTNSMTPSKIPGCRRSSGSKSRKTSGGLFRNPNDQIYEEPDELGVGAETSADQSPGPLRLKTHNTIPNTQVSSQPPVRSATAPDSSSGKLSRFEIHKNPPSQSRNPSYLKNATLPALPDSVGARDNEVQSDGPNQRDGIEIRGDDIRAATSMRMRDRSPRLPSPTVVSDQRGRPIVSFDPNWKPREKDAGQEHDKLPQDGLQTPYHPRSTASAPAIPTIKFPQTLSPEDKEDNEDNEENSDAAIEAENPTILVSAEIPSISVEEIPVAKRPLPNPTSTGRSTPVQKFSLDSSTSSVNISARHWTQSASTRRATAQCYSCALPISGRIVSAASQRFHPQCFTCHHCSTLLEHVAFYPEPDGSRNARLARIEARATATGIWDEIDGKTADDDGDDGLRFFCHLDFHEQFSPRCRNCKTPIEGEVVVACGGEWHVGHFFCAECGDPFDAKTPFVERQGYAWCVECHTKRFSGKCKGCRKPVVDLVVRALGGEWHEGCFCCKVYHLSPFLRS